MALACIIFVACQSSPENKKAKSESSEKSVSEQNKNKEPEVSGKDHPGKAVYTDNCLVCHQADGSGVPNMHPPLTPGSWVGREPKELISIMLKGLSGEVNVNGEVYKDEMPPHDQLTDDQIADVLSYIRSSFGNNFSPVTPEMVKKVRNGN